MHVTCLLLYAATRAGANSELAAVSRTKAKSEDEDYEFNNETYLCDIIYIKKEMYTQAFSLCKNFKKFRYIGKVGLEGCCVGWGVWGNVVFDGVAGMCLIYLYICLIIFFSKLISSYIYIYIYISKIVLELFRNYISQCEISFIIAL